MGGDKIRVNDLLLTVPLVGGAVWPKTKGQAALQPFLVSLVVPFDVSAAAATDDLRHTINYSLLCSLLRQAFNDQTQPLGSLEDLVSGIFDALFGREDLALNEVHLKLVQPRAPLNCKSVRIEANAKRVSNSTWIVEEMRHCCEDIQCLTIVGVNDCEREERQVVRINVSIEWKQCGIQRVDFRGLTRRLHEKVGQSSFQMLEALASYVSEETLRCLVDIPHSPVVTVRAAKPVAIVFAESSEIEISRTHADFPRIFSTPVALAIGSNLGDRFYNIELALRLLEDPQSLDFKDSFVNVVDTSFMYETAPMYVTNQPSFINCACMVETNLAPIELLKLLKKIEQLVGRVPSIRNGPRAIDLDLILYGDQTIDTRTEPRKELDDLEGQLVVPHPRMFEREFVLRPLNDMVPDLVHPILYRRISDLLATLVTPPDSTPMQKVIPFPQCPPPAGRSVPSTLTHWTLRCSPGDKPGTRVMATLNTTPDSFSDGSTHNTLPAALEYAQSAVSAGAAILDVGGYSTRPGAAFVSPEEEMSRVVPSISAIRASHPQLPMSIDTFRPSVARVALAAGANCINDVYAFTGPNSFPVKAAGGAESDRYLVEMKALAREFAVPIILMHSRGDAGTNKDYSVYDYSGQQNAVVEGVRVELGAKVNSIVKGKGGVRRWLVIVDPGVGFSKTLEGNLQVLRSAASVTADVPVGQGPLRARNPLAGFPQLIGASRKSFLGAILEHTDSGRKTAPKERSWATAAAVACAVQQGALLVRVHDTQEMADVVNVANALW
ncbi:Folic acid synthesis protein [Mycena chlorophos]|uniref:Folic acid synthesis protein n=1 Tax=Mycena chlorophos TaxID=658473 RepID=A0A8H6TIL5_MYCCL|nr:Folic acid synthesis protein [Mycena chlorophos]